MLRFNFVKKIFAAIAVTAALGFTSCAGGDAGGSPAPVKKATSVKVEIQLPGSTAGRAAYTTDDVAKYKVSAVCGDFSDEGDGLPGETVSLTLTVEGTYEFTVLGFDSDDTEIAKGTVQKALSFSEEVQTVHIDVTGYVKKFDVSVEIGWNEYVVTCSNCNTDYHNDSDVENCAKQPGCPKYTIAKENLSAGEGCDFTLLKFADVIGSPLAKRTESSSADYVYTNASDWTWQNYYDAVYAESNNANLFFLCYRF